ncbi:radical SAM protein, partial [Bacillus thuringiensis]|nr:radical SAM protein [Bacillus thuringiensis]
PRAITDILEAVDAVERTHEPYWSLDFKSELHEHLTPAPNTLTGFLTIMRGCNHRCTYCIVPQTRGPEVSRSLGSILVEAKAMQENGVQELYL